MMDAQSLVHDVELGVVQETLLIPLWARSIETKKSDPILSDSKAIEIVSKINYDFQQFSSESSSQLVVAIRGLVIDRWTRHFLQANSTPTVVEIGAGLSTRYERLDNGTSTWIDLDLPDAMAIRRRFFDESDRRIFISGSVLDEDWINQVKQSCDEPPFFIAEGLLMYFNEVQVKSLFSLMADRFPGASIAFDATSPFMIQYGQAFDAIKHTSAKFQWGIKNIMEIEDWDYRYKVAESFFLSDFPQYHNRFSWPKRFITLLAPRLLKMYGIHLVKFG